MLLQCPPAPRYSLNYHLPLRLLGQPGEGARHLETVTVTHEENARLLCFPEPCLQGSLRDLPRWGRSCKEETSTRDYHCLHACPHEYWSLPDSKKILRRS